MIDSYAGDSWAKRFVRQAVWSLATQLLPRHLFGEGPHVYLASRDASEFRVLRAFGLSELAIGVERNPDAYAMAKTAHPEADIRLGDVADVVKTLPPITIASLDFCGPICNETLDTVVAVGRRVAPRGAMLVWTLRGRDASLYLASGNRKARRANGCLGRAVPRSVGEAMSWGVWEKRLTSRESRVATLVQILRTRGLHFEAATAVAYHASSPMAVTVLCQGGMTDHIRTRSAEVRRIWDYHNSIGNDEAERLIRHLAVGPTESDQKDYMADRFCLDSGTVRAWRAHATRGTYAEVSP